MKNKLCWLSIIFFMHGCVSNAKYNFNVPLTDTPTFRLIDNRSSSDKVYTNPCANNGIGNLGDANILPDKMNFLASRMTIVSKLLSSTEIKVDKFNLYLIHPHTCEKLLGIATAGAITGAGAGNVYAYYIPGRGSAEGVACQFEFEIDNKMYVGKSFIEAQEGINAITGLIPSNKLLIIPLQNAVDKCIADALVNSSEKNK